MDVRIGLWRKLSAEELMLLNCGVGEDSWESLDCKEIQPVLGNQPWDFFGRNDAKAETLVLWPPHAKSWLIGKDSCWEGLGAGGEGDNRGWDGWMASATRSTWVWVNSRSWWMTGKPGVLQSMGSQGIGQDWATELRKGHKDHWNRIESPRINSHLQLTYIWQKNQEHSVRKV